MSENRLESLDGLEPLPKLTTLQARATFSPVLLCANASRSQLAGNRLQSASSLAPLLACCPALSSLDLSDNGLSAASGDAEALLALLRGLSSLKALYLAKGNPGVGEQLRPYRKLVIASLPGLAYLDERPVFPAERSAAEAWAKGGEAAEQAERERQAVRSRRVAFDRPTQPLTQRALLHTHRRSETQLPARTSSTSPPSAPQRSSAATRRLPCAASRRRTTSRPSNSTAVRTSTRRSCCARGSGWRPTRLLSGRRSPPS